LALGGKMKVGDLVLYYSRERSAEGPKDVGLITGFSDPVDLDERDTPLASHAPCAPGDRDVKIQWISNEGNLSYYTQEGITHNPYLEVVS
jgi:hypothetical protein